VLGAYPVEKIWTTHGRTLEASFSNDALSSCRGKRAAGGLLAGAGAVWAKAEVNEAAASSETANAESRRCIWVNGPI
jgi:hypothetical protein